MQPLLADSRLLDGIVMAVEKVRDRMQRAATALDLDHIPYAVVGDNAVAAWVHSVEPEAVRFAKDVDFLLNRADLQRATRALERAQFTGRSLGGIETFHDGSSASARNAVRIVMAGEKGRANDLEPAPGLAGSQRMGNMGVMVVPLESLVRMKLTSYRDKDRTHLRDMLDVGLVDAAWLPRLPPELAARLKHLIDTPEN